MIGMSLLTDAGTQEFAIERMAELRQAILAGGYRPRSDRVAAEIIATVGIIHRVRRRLEVLDGPWAATESRPPKHRFRLRRSVCAR
jgi:hypothetical protein